MFVYPVLSNDIGLEGDSSYPIYDTSKVIQDITNEI